MLVRERSGAVKLTLLCLQANTISTDYVRPTSDNATDLSRIFTYTVVQRQGFWSLVIHSKWHR